MSSASRPAKVARVLLVAAVAAALVLGIAAGVAIAATENIANNENFTDNQPALPTRILDIKGRLITEFFSDEKREMISIKEVPRYFIDALITREDQSFYSHHGFTVKGIVRAALGVLLHRNFGGGSTITQQLAGTLYADRRQITLKRKIVELWWALQLERHYTKEEILEQYINRMIMGPGVYGVQAASKYFFGHSARDLTLAESAILVIQLSNPTRYDPFKNPNLARARSKEVLDQMVRLGYCSKQAADDSFNEYWDNFDYTRVASSAFFMRNDKAPWFSEYVRRQLENMLYGSWDIYKDGLTVNTTLDLDEQAAADAYMKEGITEANKSYRQSSSASLGKAENDYIPIMELLGLSFDIKHLAVSEERVQNTVDDYYQTRINPAVDAAALLFGLPDLKAMANAESAKIKKQLEKTTVEGALVTIQNDTGYISALVGGAKFDQSNQLIRATQSLLMPGSSFKPLYYSAAIDSRKFTEGTMIYDSPVVLYNADGTPYIPLDYLGEWKGPVLLWYALAHSMNVPSVKVLDAIGFDAAINRAALLLGITDPAEIRRTFPRVYPLALGVIGVTPLQMARAYSVFANQGKAVTPIAIRSVEDRDGRVILEPEKDLRTQQKKLGQGIQLISPQNAAVMVDMLQRVVKTGTLAYATDFGQIFTYTDSKGKKYTMPAAGKTGTTQNWADAWTLGFTPYMTTAVWFGFDRPGNSLGVNLTGATLSGVIWAQYMRDINRGLPYKPFVRPQTGLSEVTVCAESGLLPAPGSKEGLITLLYYDGTQPDKLCDIHQFGAERDQQLLNKLGNQARFSGSGPVPDATLKIDIPGLDLSPPPPGGGPASGGSSTAPSQAPSSAAPTGGNGGTQSTQNSLLN
ncbi:MAG TPA: PBP1A family penicillin-binding protein [Rectinemataceae bacterium]|nr:PBP1A family penicillin-binding protein [Rectinemataceae bacterium]